MHLFLLSLVLGQPGEVKAHGLKKVTIYPETCELAPDFSEKVSFYTVHCADEETSATLTFDVNGTSVVMDDHMNPIDSYYGKTIDLTMENSASLMQIYVCPSEKDIGHCQQVHFDVYRLGTAEGLLGLLSVETSGTGAKGQKLSPVFDPYVFNYTVSVPLSGHFEIFASAKERQTKVGIEYPIKRKEKYSNDCMVAEERQEVWKFAVGAQPELFIICSVAPNKKTFHTYYITVNPITVLDSRAKSISVGTGKLEPPFDPAVTMYKVLVPMSLKNIDVSVSSHNPHAKILLGNEMTRKTTTGSGSYTLALPMNKRFGVPPIWARQLPIRINTTDPKDPTRFFVQDYLIQVRKDVSRYAKLKNLTVEGSACTLTPEFDPDVHEYSCVWNWDLSKWVTITPTIDFPNCVKCKLRTVDPKEVIAGHSHLNVQFQKERKVYWPDKKKWKKDFLFGEYHTVPIMIISQDQFTQNTYKVYLERQSPWWMKTSVTRFISTTATTLAIIMSVASISNVMALIKQMQFMMLTADIQGCPPVYRDYAKNLNDLNLDVGWMMPNWLGGLSPEAIKAYKDKLIREMKIKIRYCHKLEDEGKDAATSFAKTHPKVFYSRRLRSLPEQMPPFFSNSTDVEFHAQFSSHFLSAYRERQLLGSAKPLGKMKDIDCSGDEEEALVRIETAIRNLEELAKLLHGVLGNLIFILFFLIVTLSTYWTYYFLIYQHKQTRLRSLEPGPLWLFFLDYCLIMFTSSACKLMFSPGSGITLFGVTPAPWVVCAVCLFTILAYPVLFLFSIVAVITWMQTYIVGEKRPMLIWNDKLEKYSDPECHGINVSVPPPFPSFVPVFYQIFTSHIRSCIPIKDEDGKHLYYLKEDIEKEYREELKKSLVVAEISDSLKEQMECLLKDTSEDFASIQAEKEARKGEEKRLEEMRDRVKIRQGELMKAMDEAVRQQTTKEDVGIAPDWAVDIFREKPENWNWMDLLPKEVFDERAQTKKVFQSMVEMRDSMVSFKGRPDTDKLEDEERFALIQYIDQFIRRERRLHKYNILKIWPKDGFLQPLEPESTNPDDPSQDEAQFNKGHLFIENDLKQRLIYPGDEPVSFPKITPAGESGAVLQWMEEPTEGWAEWENSHKGSTTFYANKWQYVCFDHPLKPWYQDEQGDAKWWTTIIPGYDKIANMWRNRFQGRVDRIVSPEEIIEIKKWIWVELQPFMLMKMRLGLFSQQHPKYFQERKLETLAKMDFFDVWHEIDKPTVRPMNPITYESKENDNDLLSMVHEPPPSPNRRRSSARRNSLKLIKEAQKNEEWRIQNRELSDHVLMKYEDLHDKEPWWSGCDEEGPTEVKIMMDNDAFWMQKHDLGERFLEEHPYIPREGYWSSVAFTQFPEIQWGLKRYNLLKPDGNRCNVEVQIQLKHVLPVMRYVPRFKVNIQKDVLDMPITNSWKIVLGNKKRGQELNYVVDRLATLMSIVVLSAHAIGGVQALMFLLSKSMVLVNQMKSDYGSVEKEDKEVTDEQGNKKIVKVQVPFMSKAVFDTYINGDVFVWFMQSLTLFLLCVGFTGILSAPLTALLCILCTSWTMIYMNARSFKAEIYRMVNDAEEAITKLKAKTMATFYKVKDIYFRLIGKKIEVSSEFYSALKIDLIVPDIGSVFVGEPEVDPSLPPEEQREAGMKKELIYYSARANLNLPYRSVRMTERFELDIKTGMTFAMNTEQMCLREKMTQVVATIQCLNHVGDRLCSPQYDSFLTLTKPLTWEDEYDNDTQKMNELLKIWHDQVQNWLVNDLGAMRTDRTGTEDIINQIDNALEKEFGAVGTGATARRIIKMRPLSCEGIPHQRMEAGNQDFYCILLKESEDVVEAYPSERISDTVTGRWENEYLKHEGCQWDEELEVELGGGDTSIQISLYDEDMFSSDFIGFTEPILIEHLSSEYEEPIQVQLFRKSAHGNVPIRSPREGGSLLPGALLSVEEEEDQVYATITVQLRTLSAAETRRDIERRTWALAFAKKGGINTQKVIDLSPEEMDDMVKALGIRSTPRKGLEQAEGAEKKARTRTINGEEIEAQEEGWDDDPSLVDKVAKALRKLEMKGDKSQKKVIHYVLLSDHLKPSKHWKPDQITPHVAQLIVKESLVVREIALFGFPQEEEYRNGIYAKDENIMGRPSYKHVSQEVYLYFDGKERWVISPRNGDMVEQSPGFLFSTDPHAMTPDKIDQPFCFWDGESWQSNPTIFAYEHDRADLNRNWFYTTFLAKEHLSPFIDHIETRLTKALRIARMVCQKVRELLTVDVTNESKKSTVIKDCLVSMTAAGVTFRWKDMNIEYLSAFRKFLLTNFETYESAWTICMTKHMRISELSALEQVKSIFNSIDNPEYDDLRQTLEPNELVVFLQDHDLDGGPAITRESAKRMFSPNIPEEWRKLKKYLVEESMFDTFETFWAKISGGEELGIDEFYEGTKDLLKTFDPDMCQTDEDTRILSDRLFGYFDAQESGGISVHELAPASGYTLKDVDQSLLNFKVPIEYLRSVTLDPKLHRIIMSANSKFVHRPEWVSIQQALDPDWKIADPENESIQFQCRDTFYQLWKSVINTSAMHRKQAWVLHYDGQIQEHPKIPGTYIRSGYGEQRWSDGTVYQGEWKFHLPHGKGKLWRTEADLTDVEAKPYYEGDWKFGRKHGHGMLRWEQSTCEISLSEKVVALTTGVRQKGVQKVYKGEFVDDLFCGQGELFVEGGTITRVMHKERGERRGIVPLPQIDPSQILVFKGEFSSEWEMTKQYVRDVYNVDWGDLHLKIEDISSKTIEKDGKVEPNEMYEKYLGTDGHVQLTGASPIDFALDLYSRKGGDTLHMIRGTAEYADESIYEGEMQQGRPYGSGRLTQRRASDMTVGEFEVVREYDGGWEVGLKSGHGELIDFASDIEYKGEWLRDKRHGQGTIVLPPSIADLWGYSRYEGQWDTNKRHGYGIMNLRNNSQYEGQFERNQRTGKGVLRDLSTEEPKIITVTYESQIEARNDLLKLSGGTGNMVFINELWMPKVKVTKKGLFGGKKEEELEEAVNPGEGKAVNAGVLPGMQILSINDDVKAFREHSPNALFLSFGDIDVRLTIKCAHPKDSLYNGSWELDKCFTDETHPAWVLLEDQRLYHGQVNTEGVREGHGILFAHTKNECEKELLLQWHLGNEYKIPAHLDDKTKHTVLTYEGQWENNLPHGEGKQYAELAMYSGQFAEGMRHGKGKLITHDETFKYLPTDTTQGNWIRDKMHGLAMIERNNFIHSNVLYHNNECQMPYSAEGPPTTGFDGNKILGPVVKTVLKPKLFLRTEKATAPSDSRTDVDFQRISSSRQFRKTIRTKLDVEEDRKMAAKDSGFVTVIKELTDFLPSETDVVIYGATGLNEVMNGLYYRRIGTFGVRIFRHACMDTDDNFIERYLYRSDDLSKWIIGDDPDGGMIPPKPLVGTAWIQSSAERTEDIVGTWNVFYDPERGTQGKYRAYRRRSKGEVEAGRPSIDRIQMHPVAGFKIISSRSEGVLPGILIRQPTESYKRPVYECENGGQFLFWAPFEGEVIDEDTPMYLQKGAWVIGDHVGSKPKNRASGCWAYNEESAGAPDAFKKPWMSIKADETEYVEDDIFDLRMYDDRKGQTLDMLALTSQLAAQKRSSFPSIADTTSISDSIGSPGTSLQVVNTSGGELEMAGM